LEFLRFWPRLVLLKEFCEVVNSRVYVGGNVISAGGVSCSLDLGLKILEVIYGKRIAEMVADRLEISPEMRSFEVGRVPTRQAPLLFPFTEKISKEGM